MADAVSNIKIVVTATETALGTINKVQSGVKGAIDNMRSSIQSWVDDTWKASAAFTAAFGKIAKGAIDTASDFEKSGFMTRFLLDNTEDAHRFSEALVDMALSSVFTTKEITTLGSRIVGQTKDVDTSILFMNALRNSVAATGGGVMELENAQRALTQTFIKAKPSLEELNKQFNNANIPVMRVLAEHLADGSVKLKGYTDAVTVTGGAVGVSAKKLAQANEVIQDSTWKTAQMTTAMDKAKNEFGESSYQFIKAKETLGDWNEKVAGAQGTINSYNSSLGNTTKTVSNFNKTQEQIMSDLQEIAKLGVTGKDTAVALAQAMELEWKGADEALTRTMWGIMRNFPDVIEVVESSILGIEKNLEVRKGSIFWYLEEAAWKLLQFLKNNRQGITDFFDGLLASKTNVIAIASVITAMMIPALVKAAQWLGILKLLGGSLILAPIFYALALAIGAVIEQAGGFTVVIDNIKAFFGIVDNSKDSIKGMTDEYNNAQKAIDNLNQSLIPGTEAWKKHQETINTDVIPAYIGLDGKIKNAAISTTGFDDGMASIITRSKNLGKSIDDLNTKQLSPFQKIIDKIKNDTLPLFKVSINNISIAFSTFAVSLYPLVTTILPALYTLFLGLGIIFSGVVTALALLIIGFQGAALAVQMLFDVISGNQEALIQHDNQVQTLAGNMGRIIDNFATLGTSYQTTTATIGMATQTMASQVTPAFTVIDTGISSMVVNADTNLQKLPISGSTNAFGLMNNIQSTITANTPLVDTAINSTTGTVNTSLGTMPPNATENAQSLITNLKTEFDNGKPKVETSMGAIMSSVNSKMASTASSAKGHGKNTIGNFISGMIEAAKKAVKLGILGFGIPGIDLFGLANFKWQHGGIVPGPIGQPMPAIVHGGERITPRGGVDEAAKTTGSGGITINITGSVTMDSEERVQELARLIMRMLSRESELSRYGVGY